ncbi:hypothetical protein, partial [Escherichia coli]|uniref:hypothetical protein n=1 Tax=Escherichia coli TaxID=562 RepID=UPI00195640B1
ADRNRSHWSTSKTPSYTKSVSWQHHQRGGTYALTLLYIEQCHYVHKIGIALFSPRNAPHSTVYAFIFLYQRRF